MAAKKKRTRKKAPASARRRSDAQILRARWLAPAEVIRRRAIEDSPISKAQLYATYIGTDAKYRDQIEAKDGRYDYPLLSELIDLVQQRAAGIQPEEIEEALQLKIVAESRLKRSQADMAERKNQIEEGAIGVSRRWHGLTLLRAVPGLAPPPGPVADGFTGRSVAFDKHELARLLQVHPGSLITYWEQYAIRLGRLCRWSGESLTQQIPGLSDGRLPSGCNGEFVRG